MNGLLEINFLNNRAAENAEAERILREKAARDSQIRQEHLEEAVRRANAKNAEQVLREQSSQVGVDPTKGSDFTAIYGVKISRGSATNEKEIKPLAKFTNEQLLSYYDALDRPTAVEEELAKRLRRALTVIAVATSLITNLSK